MNDTLERDGRDVAHCSRGAGTEHVPPEHTGAGAAVEEQIEAVVLRNITAFTAFLNLAGCCTEWW